MPCKKCGYSIIRCQCEELDEAVSSMDGSVSDSERIDWLESNNAEIHHGPDYVFVETDRHHEDRPTLREAIDVAMNAKQNDQVEPEGASK